MEKLIIKLDVLSSKSFQQNINRDDICTPMRCVKKMIDYIPNEFWKNKSIKILDPCSGYGNFGAYCASKTSDKNITYNELSQERYDWCKKHINPKNITNKDAFDYFRDTKNKYDLIVANPPYSGGKNKNKSISNLFIEGAIDILNDDGYLCFITPNNWMSFNNNNPTLRKLLEQGQFVILDHSAKKYFNTVGSSFVIFVWKKTKEAIKTKVINNFLLKDEQEVFIEKENKFLPLYISQNILSIINKTIGDERNEFNYRCDLHNFTQKKLLSDAKDNVFKYETIHTINKTRYASIKQDIYDNWNIIIPLTTYFKPFITNKKNVTQSVGYFSFKDKNNMEIYLKKLDKEYIKVLVHITRYGNFNCTKLLKHMIINQDVKFNKKENQEIDKLFELIKY